MQTTLPNQSPLPDTRWRTRDIVIAAVIGVAFGVAFVVAGGAWKATEFLGPINRAFDPYPFVFLNLVLSMLAALQAPVIMMSQGRQANLDRRRAEADYEINLKSEIEIRQLHEKFDELRESRWAALTAQQERQIEMLTDLLRDRGTSGTNAPHTP